jgi:UDP-GlcNAc3NAcA epimerase
LPRRRRGFDERGQFAVTTRLTVLTVVGARPQFVKAAPVSRAFRASGDIEEILVHTGQHFESQMSGVFFEELGIPAPAINLEVHGGTHGAMTGRMLAAIEEQIEFRRPDWVLVYGDTNSTLAGALAAAKLHVPIAHIEAGLRSFNRAMPEEINRVVTDHVSTLLFCPTRQAVRNLAREGIASAIHIGDVMYDASRAAAELAAHDAGLLGRLGIAGRSFSIATVHRPENVDEPAHLRAVIDYLRDEASDQIIVFPVHPRTRQAIERDRLDTDPLLLCEPVSYLDMARLLAGCTTVFTDSGGLQKDAYFHRKPCVTLRNETEWIETIECGWNRLWRGPDYAPRREIDEYGDGRASERIVEVLRGWRH